MNAIYAIDFGAGTALAIHGPNGPVDKKLLRLPRVKGGRTDAMFFPMVVEALMTGGEFGSPGDVVVESATIGASGCEVDDVVELIKRRDQRLYTITTRAVKNYRADHKLPWVKGARYVRDGQPAPQAMSLEDQESVHHEDAEIIYMIATNEPYRLHHWRGPSKELQRKHTSVRPMDKRGYKDERAEQFMAMAPAYADLPDELKLVLGNGHEYSRAMVMPFIMATDEPYLDDGPLIERRKRYEKIVGLYERGYPSFYRRASVVWMQHNAKELAGVTQIADVDPETRKRAWQITQRQVRNFFHLMMNHQGR